MSNITKTYAEIYPDSTFIILDVSYESYPMNLQGIVFAEDQAGYLAGVFAGLFSSTKKSEKRDNFFLFLIFWFDSWVGCWSSNSSHFEDIKRI